jgi:hypothetical protein
MTDVMRFWRSRSRIAANKTQYPGKIGNVSIAMVQIWIAANQTVGGANAADCGLA